MDFGWDQVHGLWVGLWFMFPCVECGKKKVHCVSQALIKTSVPTQRAWGEVFTIGSNQMVEVVD